jgi:hypothetical protein
MCRGFILQTNVVIRNIIADNFAAESISPYTSAKGTDRNRKREEISEPAKPVPLEQKGSEDKNRKTPICAAT